MAETNNNNLRLRIRLKTGEEFEAEGDLDFISEQKHEFYKLTYTSISKKSPSDSLEANIPSYLKRGGGEYNNQAPARSSFTTEYTQNTDTETASQQRFSRTPSKFTPAHETPSTSIKGLKKPVLLPNQEVWDKVALYNGTSVVLRQKYKNVSTAEAALIILGAAKILKDISSMTALELSKCLKLSGYLKDGERLDRAVGHEVKEASLLFEGSKRNRSYIITQKGLAKAFTTAERALF